LCLKETDLVFPIGTVRAEVEHVIDVLARGEVPAARFVLQRIRQDEIPDALHDLGTPRDQVKVVVEYVS
jgi:threonine dehydrogenase-like Zn-dependent dehydrogenase